MPLTSWTVLGAAGMRTVRNLTLLAGLLILFQPLLSPQVTSSDNHERGGLSATQEVSRREYFESPPADSHRRDALRHKAETNEERAVALRRKQTGRDLNAAIALFQESARLFEKARLRRKAADTYLQIGEIYFILRNAGGPK